MSVVRAAHTPPSVVPNYRIKRRLTGDQALALPICCPRVQAVYNVYSKQLLNRLGKRHPTLTSLVISYYLNRKNGYVDFGSRPQLFPFRCLVHLEWGVAVDIPDLRPLETLQTLKFRHGCHPPCKDLFLPLSLKSLGFAKDFDNRVDDLILPPALEHLDFGTRLSHTIERLQLPMTLQTLALGWAPLGATTFLSPSHMPHLHTLAVLVDEYKKLDVAQCMPKTVHILLLHGMLYGVVPTHFPTSLRILDLNLYLNGQTIANAPSGCIVLSALQPRGPGLACAQQFKANCVGCAEWLVNAAQ